jgi:hypothetical protein
LSCAPRWTRHERRAASAEPLLHHRNRRRARIDEHAVAPVAVGGIAKRTAAGEEVEQAVAGV